MRAFLLIYCLWAPLLCWSDTCLFTPPTGWHPIKAKDLSRTEIGFSKKGNSHFNPSINLAFEEVDCDLKEYLKAVKQIHTAQPNTRWNDLGAIEMKAGTGRLTEIRKPSPCGEIALLQAIFIEKNTAYILTAAVLKQELVSNQKELLTSLRSLELVPDIWSSVQDPNLKKDLIAYVEADETSSKEEWKSFQKLVEKSANLGSYWQYLALSEANRRSHE